MRLAKSCSKAMFGKAEQRDMLSRNPMDKVDAPKFKKTKAKYLTDDEAVDPLRRLAAAIFTQVAIKFSVSTLCAVNTTHEIGQLSRAHWTVAAAGLDSYDAEVGHQGSVV